ncbi:hypothetical protein M501DRAFT_1002497 [Patellaria atrata CBS 101060]|uniref:UBC core domain-containing protein n=1 Tax=Patellaria atrata CBS 101060 TaxID=1346257 RepID=A0A9P4VS87_9PEZI|nr:hypothetical protein M501DRAFT_1002497 [Patellaria atrata CBS 101060]
MPRKSFIADLKIAIQGVNIPYISNVQKGEDDGQFTFNLAPKEEGLSYTISAIIPDVSDYPSTHDYHVFAEDGAPSSISNVLMGLTRTSGLSVIQLLELVSRSMDSADSRDRDGDTPMPDSQEEGADRSDSESENYGFSDSEEEENRAGNTAPDASTYKYFTSNAPILSSLRSRIRRDLKTAKDAGFKIGHLASLLDGGPCFVTVSCRVAKLGISEEAMHAWQVKPQEYLVLILHYQHGYKPMEMLTGGSKDEVKMRVAIGPTYKPSLGEAIRIFAELSKHTSDITKNSSRSKTEDPYLEDFRETFISKPLNGLLNERLIYLINTRYMGMTWRGAEAFYQEHMGIHTTNSDMLNDKYIIDEQINPAYPSIVNADHIRENNMSHIHSFPLIAMQYMLRHFVRCTEFCLNCHTKLENDLEALKPYVCDSPLCLYQYMSLGFGPSIEHEIIAQPHVVDLLVSFCYASARSLKLKDFPSGLALLVPPPLPPKANYAVPGYYTAPTNGLSVTSLTPSATAGNITQPKVYEMRFDRSRLELIFDTQATCPVSPGSWIVIQLPNSKEPHLHCRVVETTFFPTVKVTGPIPLNTYDPRQHYVGSYGPSNLSAPVEQWPLITPATTPGLVPASFYIYDINFDLMSARQKQDVICDMLDTLPSVQEMRRWLLQNPMKDLQKWVERISPAALGILRWVIASNRACIVQVDDLEVTENAPKNKNAEERVYGMSGWVQFRFAMGAPDKERRFLNSVRQTSARLGLTYPTLFAWHGSSLANWHSIIREGLHFNDIAHGRAFGNGVYHSLQYQTSMGYSNMYSFQSQAYGYIWPNSQLKIKCALALNEIVNAPSEYVSKDPHLVVSQLEWIQTRYLFVQSSETKNFQESRPAIEYKQDPIMRPTGVREPIVIPISAVSKSRRPVTINRVPAPGSAGNFKSKDKGKSKNSGTTNDPIVLDDDDTVNTVIVVNDDYDDDTQSIDTDIEDLEILFEEESAAIGSNASEKAMTDFVPGSLDSSTLQRLEPPAFATIHATKRLTADLKALIKTQETTPLHELGWYVDPELCENLYQWIIELHSFEPHLPLARDMKDRKITSVVLELRFGGDYPMSPPFVRVVRPRFLSFMAGGGGHITAGGALCMELLTNNGWSAVSSIESVLLQVRLAISSLEPRPARLENGPPRDYNVGEAVEAYIRACQAHNWTVPVGFREMVYGG